MEAPKHLSKVDVATPLGGWRRRANRMRRATRTWGNAEKMGQHVMKVGHPNILQIDIDRLVIERKHGMPCALGFKIMLTFIRQASISQGNAVLLLTAGVVHCSCRPKVMQRRLDWKLPKSRYRERKKNTNTYKRHQDIGRRMKKGNWNWSKCTRLLRPRAAHTLLISKV